MRPKGRRSAVEEQVVQVMVSAVERHGYGCRVERGGVVRLTGPRTGAIAFADVRVKLAELPRTQWAGAIYDHVVDYLTELELAGEPVVDLDDPDAIRPALRSRVYRARDLSGGDVLCRPLAGSLLEACMVAGERTLRTVPAALPERWDVPADEVYAAARSATREHAAVERAEHDAGGVPVVELYGAGPYVTSCVFWLDELIELPAGAALVTLPARGVLLAHPVAPETTLRAVRVLGSLAERVRSDETGPLSAEVFGWREGSLTVLDPESDLAARALAELTEPAADPAIEG